MIDLKSDIAKKIEENLSNGQGRLNELATKDSEAIYERPHLSDPIAGNFSDDTDKIINTKAYTRYMGKTQVFSMIHNDLITTRGLHVQLVSKIARNIGRCLGFNEDLIEAIALGHDLGHTPFGHEGEHALNEITLRNGYYFKHNAQSTRILRDIQDCNVSLQVLDGITCHNGESVEFIDAKNGGGYKPNKDKTPDEVIEEYKRCFKEKDFDKTMVPMTYEGCIMRVSDLISYVGRDFEDAISLGLLRREDMPNEIRDVLGDNPVQIVRSLTYDIVNNSFGKDSLNFSKECFEAFNELFDFNYRHIYLNPEAKPGSKKRDAMFPVMVEKYLKDLQDVNTESPIFNFVSSSREEYRKNTSDLIKVVDFIAGMTDGYFKREFENYIMPETVFGKIL